MFLLSDIFFLPEKDLSFTQFNRIADKLKQ